MRTTVHDLDSLRYIIRNLQEENTYLKRILDDNEILYETKDTLDEEKMPDDYDEDHQNDPGCQIHGNRLLSRITTLRV